MNSNASEHSDHLPSFQRSHDGIVLALARQNLVDHQQDSASRSRTSAGEAQIRLDVDRAIQAIKTAGSSIGALNEKSRAYEEVIRDLKRANADLKHGQEAAEQRTVKAEARCRQESERAQNAETRVRSCETQIKQMEHREKTVAANLDRVMRLVEVTFGGPERIGEPSKIRPLVPTVHGSSAF